MQSIEHSMGFVSGWLLEEGLVMRHLATPRQLRHIVHEDVWAIRQGYRERLRPRDEQTEGDASCLDEPEANKKDEIVEDALVALAAFVVRVEEDDERAGRRRRSRRQ